MSAEEPIRVLVVDIDNDYFWKCNVVIDALKALVAQTESFEKEREAALAEHQQFSLDQPFTEIGRWDWGLNHRRPLDKVNVVAAKLLIDYADRILIRAERLPKDEKQALSKELLELYSSWMKEHGLQ